MYSTLWDLHLFAGKGKLLTGRGEEREGRVLVAGLFAFVAYLAARVVLAVVPVQISGSAVVIRVNKFVSQ